MSRALLVGFLLLAINVYGNLIFARIILSYIPVQLPPALRPASNFLYDISEPFLKLFRGLIPAFGGLDLSPLLGFLALRILARLVEMVGLG